ncbi:hypothetical protein FisN_16Lh216 [Fistulifera solaris]|uniref:PTM/DIR17-like Tudor domain-containing protein n=1 Tax=Fistulifera solaris TaxID=1519565 RepID=A0A1Z5J697_FISSO|nr:hypothetical protein FisN_16Lh216 [Fistulifera solaris]|eukprot:GAX09523.1 hypothetical protein FisN_16Lh216 [Fistulifera solaris]
MPIKRFPSILVATWPEALPHPEETEILSVVVYPDCMRWGLHVRVHDHFRVKCWWKTFGSTLPEDESLSLIDILPPYVHPSFMGNRIGSQAIQEWSFVRRIPFWTVYVMTVDKTIDAAPVLQHLFRDVPCRLFAVQHSDFFADQAADIQDVPISLVSSLQAVLRDAEQEDGPPPSILLLDTNQTPLQYAACDGTQVLGFGTGPSWNIPLSGPQEIFSRSRVTKPSNLPAYQQLIGIVYAWEHQTKHKKQCIWIYGSNKSHVERIEGILKQELGSNMTIRTIPDLVHRGIDEVLKEQTRIHGEMSEPMDLVLVGQRIKIKLSEQAYVFATIRNRIPGTSKAASIQEYQYNVELDDGKHQQVLRMEQILLSIEFYIEHMKEEKNFLSQDSDDEYTKLSDRKVEAAKSVLSLFEKEWNRLRAAQKGVATHSIPPRKEVQSYSEVSMSQDDRDTLHKAAQEADPAASRKLSYVGRRVGKHFKDGLFYGTVSKWFPAAVVDNKVDLWLVDYDDGDTEDYEEDELQTILL